MPPVRRKKACWPCRSQKVKCDAEPPSICSRCRRMSLPCVLSSDTNARQTKAQLQHELNELKGAGGSGDDGNPSTLTENQTNPVTAMSVSRDLASTTSLLSASISLPPDFQGEAGREIVPPNSGPHRNGSSSRTFYENKIDGRKIEDCVILFFRHYYPSLPIVDPNLNADEYFDICPLLFWTIIFIGSRKYASDPTLMACLGPKMNSMALTSLETRTDPLHTIQALLMLCVWPTPTNTMYKDMSLVLSGAAIHLAMQNGLHVSGSGQDFSRTRLTANQKTNVSRTQLWVHCVFVCNCTSLREGIPPLTLSGTLGAPLINETLLSGFSPEMQTRCEIHDILMSATAALMRILGPMKSENTTLDCLSYPIRLFDAQLARLSSSGIKDFHNLIHLNCCRVHLLAYHFLEKSPHKLEGLIDLYKVSCNVIQLLLARGKDQEEYYSIFIERTIFLAAIGILKILKSSELTHIIDGEAGEKAYFDAIRLCRRMSLQNDDLSARAATILSQLWISKHLFTRPDGKIDSLGTRIKSRLSMSIVFDCFWWWREEFAGQPSPYNDNRELQGQETPTETEFGVPDSANFQTSGSLPMVGAITDMSIFSEEPFPDYEWAANVNFRHIDWIPEEEFDVSGDRTAV